MAPAVRSTVGALRVARIVLEDAIVPKVNVVVVNVLVLQQIENVIQMFVGIVGSAVVMVLSGFPTKEVTIMSAGT